MFAAARMMNRFYVILILSICVYFSNLGGTSIYILDEAKNAGCAMEMKNRSDWIVPVFNDVLRTDKPPLHYYFMGVSYAVFGVTPFAARFFSALAGVLLILVVYRNVTRIINSSVAFYAALVILSSIQLTIQFHLAVPDPYLILFITLCLFSFFNGFHNRSKEILVFYLASALGFMTKGPIAVVMPGLIIVLYLAFTQPISWATLKRLNLPLGIVLFCVVALPWYALVGYYTDGVWLRGFFIEHNLDRYTATMEGHRGFMFAPFVILFAALLPFSVFSIQSFRLMWRDRAQHPFLLFCTITGLVFALFFSFSKTILPSYPAPAIPFLAVIMAYFLFRLEEGEASDRRYHWISLLFQTILSVALCVAAYFALTMEPTLTDLVEIAWIFVVLPLGSLAGWYFYAKENLSFFVYSWSGSWIILSLLFFYLGYPRIDSKDPVTMSLPIFNDFKDNHRIIGYHIFNPAYVFALKHPIPVVDSPDKLKEFSNSGERILVITRKKYLEELSGIGGLKVIYSAKDLFEKTETVVLSN